MSVCVIKYGFVHTQMKNFIVYTKLVQWHYHRSVGLATERSAWCLTPDTKSKFFLPFTLYLYLKLKAKARDSYIARLTGKPDHPRCTIIHVTVDRQEPVALHR